VARLNEKNKEEEKAGNVNVNMCPQQRHREGEETQSNEKKKYVAKLYSISANGNWRNISIQWQLMSINVMAALKMSSIQWLQASMKANGWPAGYSVVGRGCQLCHSSVQCLCKLFCVFCVLLSNEEANQCLM